MINEKLKSSSMSNRETKKSHALGMRLTEIKARMQEAQITEDEMKTFQRSRPSWRATRAESRLTT